MAVIYGKKGAKGGDSYVGIVSRRFELGLTTRGAKRKSGLRS